MTTRTCSIDDCDEVVLARGWCRRHYYRWVNAGKPDDWTDDSGPPRRPATDEQILNVARAHGAKIAAEWAPCSPQHALDLLHRVDGYYRGPGRPSPAELAARAPRLTCDCGYCIDWRSDEATRANIRHAATEADELLEPAGGWRHLARCAGTDPDVFFPDHVGPASTYLYDEARAICARCPVTEPCLRFALDNHIDHGIYGGLDPRKRARIAGAKPPRREREPDTKNRQPRGARKPLTPDDPRHGTVNGYTNLACRCDPCTDAGREYQRQRKQTA